MFFSNHLQFLKPCTNYADCFNVFSMFQKAGANRHSFVHRWLLGLWDRNNWVKTIFLVELFWGMNFVFVSHTLFNKVSSLGVSVGALRPSSQPSCSVVGPLSSERSQNSLCPNIPPHPNFYGLIFLLLLCFCSASRVSTLIKCNERCTCTRSRLYGNKTHADLHLNNTVCNIVCLAHILSSSPEPCPPTKLTGSACLYIWDLNLWGPWSMNYPDLKWSLTHAMGNTDPCQHVSMLFPSVATVFWQQMSLR